MSDNGFWGRLRTLWRLMQGQRLRYGGAIGAIVLGTLFAYGRPLICRGAIDHIIQEKPLQGPDVLLRAVQWLGGRSVLARNLWLAGAAIVVVTAVSGVFGYLKGRLSARAAESIARRLRDRLYDQLQHLPCAYHDTTQTGDLVQRCTSDVETIRMFLATHVVEIGRATVLMAVALPILLSINVRMTLLSTAVIPLVLVAGVVFFLKVKATFQRVEQAEGRMTSRLQENLAGIRVVRAFARQEFECDRFGRANAEYRDRWHGMIKVLGWYWPCSDLMCISQTGVVLLVGAHHVTRGEMTVGTLYLFIACVGMFLWPVRHMGRILADLGKALVALGRVGEILSQQPETGGEQAGASLLPGPAAGEVAIEGLSFSHGEEAGVLSNLSMRVGAGETVAILGPAGAGKSTLIHLLLRLYDYETGSISLDGVELNDLPRKRVRSQIGVVLQEPFLYSKSLRENILLGHTAAEDQEMVEAASAACIHESIAGFEMGYDTYVGERGVTLSGGQRQRVALARALLRDPPILILDDAFSAVDTQTESIILRAIRQRRGRRTTLLIAHRLTTLMHADRIVVLDGGHIAQQGTHRELLAQEGMYRRLWRIQGSLQQDTDAPGQAPAGQDAGRSRERP